MEKYTYNQKFFDSHFDRMEIETFYKDGLLHNNPDFPAWVSYWRNGNVRERCWFKNGKSHRVKGPSTIKYDEEGNVYNESWTLNGLWHREDGPNVVCDGEGLAYSLYGDCMTKDMFLPISERLMVIKTRDQAILNIRSDCKYVQIKCQEILNADET